MNAFNEIFQAKKCQFALGQEVKEPARLYLYKQARKEK